MIQYANIGAQTCDALLEEMDAGQAGVTNQLDTYSLFQYRLGEWRKRITTDFKYAYKDQKTEIWNHRLQALLFLRANHLQILVARCLLYHNRLTRALLPDIKTHSVDMAADTVRILAHLGSSTTAPRINQAHYNYFLITALGVLLLVIIQESSNRLQQAPSQKYVSMIAEAYIKAQKSAMVEIGRAHV